MSTPTPLPTIEMPPGFIVIKGPDSAIYGSWLGTGYVRKLTAKEYEALGSPKWRSADQAEADELAALHRALHA